MSTSHSPRRHPNFKDLSGQRFGFLTVLHEDTRRWKGRTYGRWVCRCDCGNATTVPTAKLTGGFIKSCGCAWRRLIAESRTTHGATKGRAQGKRETTEYQIWEKMRQRCLNPNDPAYKDYGGRGIGICSAWRSSFTAFLADVGRRPKDGRTLDRKNNMEGYHCGRCKECLENGWAANWRWATKKEQSNNRRNNIIIEWRGQRMNLKQWSEHLGLPYLALYLRIKRRKWSIEKAFTTPLQTSG